MFSTNFKTSRDNQHLLHGKIGIRLTVPLILAIPCTENGLFFWLRCGKMRKILHDNWYCWIYKREFRKKT